MADRGGASGADMIEHVVQAGYTGSSTDSV